MINGNPRQTPILDAYKGVAHDVVSKEIQIIKDELAELALLGNTPETKDVYSMSYNEYMELDGNVRL